MRFPELVYLGWGDRQDRAYDHFCTDGTPVDRNRRPVRVVIRHNSIYTVSDGRGDFHAHLSGRLRHSAQSSLELPAVGDWVVLERSRGALITAVLPRTSVLARKIAGNAAEPQVLAANIDLVVVMSSTDLTYSPNRIERYLKMVADSGIQAVVVLNKCDLVEDSNTWIDEVSARNPSTPVFALSARNGTGMVPVSDLFRRGSTTAVIGPSGVGKSSFVNRLLGSDRLRTADVRDADDKGRHTTTHRELVLLPGGGMIVDTPGMRELQLWQDEDDASESEHDNFADIEELAASCRFSDCTHEHEPDCAVLLAVASGRLDTRRIDNYRKIAGELTYLARRKGGQNRADRGIARGTHNAATAEEGETGPTQPRGYRQRRHD